MVPFSSSITSHRMAASLRPNTITHTDFRPFEMIDHRLRSVVVSALAERFDEHPV